MKLPSSSGAPCFHPIVFSFLEYLVSFSIHTLYLKSNSYDWNPQFKSDEN